jgi:hypothetical protein
MKLRDGKEALKALVNDLDNEDLFEKMTKDLFPDDVHAESEEKQEEVPQ